MNHLEGTEDYADHACHEPFLMHSLSDIIYQVPVRRSFAAAESGEFEEFRYILVFEEKTGCFAAVSAWQESRKAKWQPDSSGIRTGEQ